MMIASASSVSARIWASASASLVSTGDERSAWPAGGLGCAWAAGAKATLTVRNRHARRPTTPRTMSPPKAHDFGVELEHGTAEHCCLALARRLERVRQA